MAEFYLEVKNIDKDVIWQHIILMLRQETITQWIAFALTDSQKRDLKSV